jgi:predicted lipid-binding transport protein (Tim44 family)
MPKKGDIIDMWKKMFALFVTFSLLFGTVAPLIDSADAKPRYRSPSKSYKPDAAKDSPQRTDNVNNGAATTKPGATAPGTRSPFGGGLMKGLFLGGLAGLMFGGLLAGLGGLGPILGLLINVIALFALFVLVRKAVRYFMNRNRNHPRDDYR